MPIVCVYFKYEGGDPAGFWIEWTENGEAMPSDLGTRATCNYNYALCDALAWFHRPSSGSPRYVKAAVADQGFQLTQLPYDTEYCFRFAAINEDNLVSDHWTDWVCARTPPPPPAPVGSIGNPRLSIIQGVPARGVSIPETPTRILIEWDKPAPQDHVGWFRVDRWITRSGAAVDWEQYQRVYPREDDPSDSVFPTTEAIDQRPANWTPDRAARYRICAVNASGEYCSKTLYAVDRFATVPGVEQTPHVLQGGRRDLESHVGDLSPFITLSAPVLLEPVAGAHIAMGQLRVRIDAAAVAGKMVEFDLARGDNRVFWRVKADQALAGVVLPAELTNGLPGKWNVSAKFVEPAESSPSAAVEVELTNPVANAGGPSQGGKARVMRRVITPRSRVIQSH
jgi:hypothetical protein